MNTGKKLWNEAIEVIPGGNGLLSKRPDRYGADIWPTYYSKAKGVSIWDLDQKEYIDMAQMGIGSAILGYSDDDVNKKVKEAIDLGVNTTLNCPEEVQLAKKLLELNPFAGGVKFARTGGEAMAMAVRIARASSGKEKVAFSGYHGWSDWYLATNISGDQNLEKHLLPHLKAKGVPRGLINTSIGFEYNNIADLRRVFTENPDIGVIVIEGARYDFPTSEFLKEIETLARTHGALIVTDEITSGWRLTSGGVYKINGFRPDIVVYGKALGNGFAISAVLGRKEVMDVAQDTFISSTFWTERVGFVAALATIEKLTKNKVWEHLIHIGSMIGEGWKEIAHRHGINLSVSDFKPLITMKLNYGDKSNLISTLFTQEMLKRGYIASTSVYVSYAHNEKIIHDYLKKVEEVFELIARAMKENSLESLLETRLKEQGFKRVSNI